MISLCRFDKKEVPDDVLQRVVEKINLCPTAGNKQVRKSICMSVFVVIFCVCCEISKMYKRCWKGNRSRMGGKCAF